MALHGLQDTKLLLLNKFLNKHVAQGFVISKMLQYTFLKE